MAGWSLWFQHHCCSRPEKCSKMKLREMETSGRQQTLRGVKAEWMQIHREKTLKTLTPLAHVFTQWRQQHLGRTRSHAFRCAQDLIALALSCTPHNLLCFQPLPAYQHSHNCTLGAKCCDSKVLHSQPLCTLKNGCSRKAAQERGPNLSASAWFAFPLVSKF